MTQTVQTKFKPGDLVRFKTDAESQEFRRLLFSDMPEVLVIASADGDVKFEGSHYVSDPDLLELAPLVVVRDGASYIDYTGKTVGQMMPLWGRFIAVRGDGRVWNVDGTGFTQTSNRLVAEVTAEDAAEVTQSKQAPAAYYLVHGLGPTNVRHRTREAADREALRLSKRHPGTNFFVMQSVSRVRVPIGEPEVTPLDGGVA